MTKENTHTNTPTTFAQLGLCDAIVKTISDKGYTAPTPIQAQAIPPILAGKDVMAASQTGTGKTAGFTLPLLDRLRHNPRAKAHQARVLILTPTRELAAQVAESVETYSKNLSLSSAVVFGGVNINPQKKRLARGVDILIATPGRLLDLYNQRIVSFPNLELLVLDEADRMLDMGFIHDIKRIMKVLPTQRQTLLFSATFSSEIRQLAKSVVKDPIELTVTPPNSTVEVIEQSIYPVDKKDKATLLQTLIKDNDWQQILVFCRTKHGANKLAQRLEKNGIRSAAIHGNKSQGARTRALEDFKKREVTVLVATDIAARGLDIEQLPHVINFELPNVPEDYVHRIGRTGRAGAKGHAISLVSRDEFEFLVDIEFLIKKIIPREETDGIVKPHHLPPSSLDKKPSFPKKKKKPQQNNRGPKQGHSRNKSRGPRPSRNSQEEPEKPEAKKKKRFWFRK